METAYFTYRGVRYLASGWLWASDGAANGLAVERADGRKIRGVRTNSGIQTGRSDALTAAAERAMEEAHAKSR